MNNQICKYFYPFTCNKKYYYVLYLRIIVLWSVLWHIRVKPNWKIC